MYNALSKCWNGLAGSADVLAEKELDYLWLSAAWKTHSTRGHPQRAAIWRRVLFITPEHFPSLSSGWAMKVQLISDSAVHTSGTKARLVSQERGWQQFSNSLRLRKSPWSLKDARADNRFTDELMWEGIKETYTLTDRQGCVMTLLFHLSDASSHRCHVNSKWFALLWW